MGKLIKDFPQVALDAMAAAPKLAETPNPVAYLVATAKKLADAAAGVSAHPIPTVAETKAQMAKEAQAAASPSPKAREHMARLRPAGAQP